MNIEFNMRQYEEPYEMIVLTGQVALYELCFEQSWKSMKEIIEDHGYSESIALDIVHRTKEKYIDMFDELEKELMEKWA